MPLTRCIWKLVSQLVSWRVVKLPSGCKNKMTLNGIQLHFDIKYGFFKVDYTIVNLMSEVILLWNKHLQSTG